MNSSTIHNWHYTLSKKLPNIGRNWGAIGTQLSSSSSLYCYKTSKCLQWNLLPLGCTMQQCYWSWHNTYPTRAMFLPYFTAQALPFHSQLNTHPKCSSVWGEWFQHSQSFANGRSASHQCKYRSIQLYRIWCNTYIWWNTAADLLFFPTHYLVLLIL